MNCVILTGRLVKDPDEIRYIGNGQGQEGKGKEYLKSTIAVRREFKNKNGEYDADFIDLTFFGAQAKYISMYAKKGDMIEVFGKWNVNKYTDKAGYTKEYHSCTVQSASIISNSNSNSNKSRDMNVEEENNSDFELKENNANANDNKNPFASPSSNNNNNNLVLIDVADDDLPF